MAPSWHLATAGGLANNKGCSPAPGAIGYKYQAIYIIRVINMLLQQQQTCMYILCSVYCLLHSILDLYQFSRASNQTFLPEQRLPFRSLIVEIIKRKHSSAATPAPGAIGYNYQAIYITRVIDLLLQQQQTCLYLLGSVYCLLHRILDLYQFSRASNQTCLPEQRLPFRSLIVEIIKRKHSYPAAPAQEQIGLEYQATDIIIVIKILLLQQ